MNFIIIHGVYASPEANWFPWLKKELESRGYEVIVPKFPTPLDQSLESWLRVFANYENKINEETVLVGHSLGAAFILNYLENVGIPLEFRVDQKPGVFDKASKKIKAAYLVSPFHKLLGAEYDEINKTFLDKEFNWEKIRQSCNKFFVFASDNDKYIPLEVTNDIVEKLNAEFNIVPKGGHLNKESGYEEFYLLLECIMIDLD